MHMDTHGQNIHTDRQTYIHFIAEGEIEWREDEKLTRLRKAMGNMAIHHFIKATKWQNVFTYSSTKISKIFINLV